MYAYPFAEILLQIRCKAAATSQKFRSKIEAIRAGSVQPQGMSDTQKSPLTLRVSERLHGGTSEAYLWLRLHYAQLKKRMAVRFPPYAEVAAEMAAEGVKAGQSGREKPVTAMSVRRMWPRVCRDVAEDARRRATAEKMPAGWAPVPVAIRPAPVPEPARPAPVDLTASRPAPPRLPTPSRRPDDPAPVRTPEEIQSELDAVREQLQQDRAWLPGQKRAAPRV